MLLEAKIGLSGVFKNVEILRSDGTVRLETGEFTNLITDIGLARLASHATAPVPAYNVMRVSTDGSAPSVTDTGLEGQVATATQDGDGISGVNVAEGFCWRRLTWTFALGAIANQNISKLATGWGTGEGSVFSIALIKDALGNPTSITILEDEQLRVTWEHRRYWPTADVTGSIVNEGNKGGAYNYTVRACRVGQWSAGNGRYPQIGVGDERFNPASVHSTLYQGDVVLGGIGQDPQGAAFSLLPALTTVGSTGVNRAGRLFNFPLTVANSALGIGGIKFGMVRTSTSGTSVVFQAVFDPPIMKTAEDLLEIGVEINWGRA